jgi:hypothetical protein
MTFADALGCRFEPVRAHIFIVRKSRAFASANALDFFVI